LPDIYGISRSPFDKLRANGRLDQSFSNDVPMATEAHGKTRNSH
jgi:hypothetical protein